MKSLEEIQLTIKKYQDAIEERRVLDKEGLSFKDCHNLRHICNAIYYVDTTDYLAVKSVIPALRDAARDLRDIVRVPYAVRAYNFLIKLDIIVYKKEQENFDDDLGYDDIFNCLACRNLYVYDDCEDIIKQLQTAFDEDLLNSILEESKSEWHNHLKRDPVELTEDFLKCIDEVQLIVEKKIKHDPNLSRWKLIKEELALRGINWTSPATLNEGALFD